MPSRARIGSDLVQTINADTSAPANTINISANGQITVNNNFLPAANVTYDLGTSALRWRDLYLSGSTIKLGNATLSSNGDSLVLPSNTVLGIGGSSLSTDGGSGTVTSVGGTGTVQGISLSGTVTESGNLTLGGSLSDINLSSQVTGTLPVSSGGTGATSLTDNNVLIGNGTGAIQTVAPGTSGNILTSTGSGWQSSAPAGGGGNWEHSLTTTASDAASVSFTLSGGSLYAIVIKDMRGEHSGFGNLSVKFSNLTSSLYGYSYTTSSGGLSAVAHNQAQSILASGRVGSDSGSFYGHLNGIVYINPGGNSQFPAMWYNGSMMNQDQRAQNVSGGGSYASDSSTGTSAVLFNTAGNITGTFIFYKITT